MNDRGLFNKNYATVTDALLDICDFNSEEKAKVAQELKTNTFSLGGELTSEDEDAE